MSIPDSLGEFSFVCCSCLASPSAKVTVCQECFISSFLFMLFGYFEEDKQFKSLTWLAGSGVSIFCCKKFVNWAFELWLGGLLQAEWRIKIDEPYWQTWYILVLFHGIRMVFFFGPLLATCIVKDQSQRYLGISGNSAWNFHKGKNRGDMAKSKLKADEKNLTLT